MVVVPREEVATSVSVHGAKVKTEVTSSKRRPFEEITDMSVVC